MTTIVTRITNPTGGTAKGSPLSSAEIDQNFINLNDNKLELTDLVSTNTANKGVKRDSSGGFSAGDISVGAVSATSITINGGAVPVGSGGTGQSTYTSGQLLIGTSGGSLSKATITGTLNQIVVTNGSGSITLSAPQDIGTGSNPQFGSLGVGTAASGTAGEIRAINQITAYYSDERLKENIQIIPNALEKVSQLRGVTYRANKVAESFGYKNKEQQVGVLAGDVEQVLPEAVKPAPFDILLFEGVEISKSGQNYKTVQYEKIVPLLIEAIKELNIQVQQLKEQK